MKMDEPVNVFGDPLLTCGMDPVTGYFRDGHCNTCSDDVGSHTVCVEVSEQFLAFSLSRGNDLSTPKKEFGFPGLAPGDHWCLCAARWLEAEEAGVAPRVYLQRTHIKALEVVPLTVLRQYAADLN